MQWRAAVESRKLLISETALLRLYASPIEVVARPLEEVLSRFLSIRDMAHEPLLLREVSSRVFWGLSKLLHGRADAVAALLEEHPRHSHNAHYGISAVPLAVPGGSAS